MVERIKDKKGFTIIEIMVVIALIGILAAVLVPKFTGVKDTAKNAGMLTNAKMVEAYVASTIDSYKMSDTDPAGAFEDDIIAHFANGDALVNPYTGDTADNLRVEVLSTGAYSGGITGGTTTEIDDAGITFVVIDSDTLDAYINGFDAKGKELKATERTITR